MMALKIVFNNFNEPVEPFPATVFNNIPALFCTQRSELIILMEKIKIVKEKKVSQTAEQLSFLHNYSK